MNILISGGTGFLGKYVVERFRGKGIRLTVISRSKNALAGCDVIKPEDLDVVTASRRFDAFLHLATLYDQPDVSDKDLLYVNVEFPLAVIQSIDRTTSQCSYYIGDTFFSFTDRRYEYQKRYIASKRALLKKLDLLDVKYSRLVISHLFGDGESETRFSGWLVKKIRAREEIFLGSCTNTRDFIHAQDAAWLIAEIILNNIKTELPVVIGTGNQVSVRKFVEDICASLGGDPSRLQFSKDRDRCFDSFEYPADILYAANLVRKRKFISPFEAYHR